MTNMDEKEHDVEAASSHTSASSTTEVEDRPAQTIPASAIKPAAKSGDVDDKMYERFSPKRKLIITTVVTIGAFLPPIGSTMVLSAIPQVAAQFSSTGTTIGISNALYMLSAGLSPCFLGPLTGVYGRRMILLISAVLYSAFSLGTALAPNLAAYFVFRILTAFQGTAFLVLGSSVLGDIYRPVERATAVGWFMLGFELGPTFGPFFGGIIVTYRSWRCLFYLQTALGVLATFLVAFFLPETILVTKSAEMGHLSWSAYIHCLAHLTNPLRVLRLFRYRNILSAGLASSSLLWNMYSLLTPIPYVLNPRFDLTSPLQSALFYLAPGAGYILGTFLGGRWADYIVKRNIKQKNGVRVPEDRLKSCLPFFGIVLPAAMLVYGWSVDLRFGGVPLPTIMMFVQGLAQMFAFPSLNTYCLDVMQGRGQSAEVVAGNYFIRYLFAAAGSASCLPAVQSIGVGWFTVISAAFLAASAALIWATTIWGQSWRESVDEKLDSRAGL